MSLDLVGRPWWPRTFSTPASADGETSLWYSDSDGFSAEYPAGPHLGVGAARQFAPNMAATLDPAERCRQDLCVDSDGHQSEWAP